MPPLQQGAYALNWNCEATEDTHATKEPAMPMIDLTLPAGALQRSALTTLVEDLTTTVLHWERVADNPATRAMAWAFVHELPSGAVNVGGKPAELPIYRVFLTVPQCMPRITGPLNE